MQTLDPREEQNLLSAIKRAVDLVDGGLAPDDAITKVAKDEKYTPGKIKLVCAAYNTGKQTAQREDNKSILDKFAEFPLASADNVIANIYGKSEKSASVSEIDAAYNRAPGNWYADREREKFARMHIEVSAPAPDPIPTFEKVMGQLDKIKQAAAESRRNLSTKSDVMNIKFAALLNYFRLPAKHRETFGVVEKIASTFFDSDSVTSLMDSVYARLDLSEKYVGSFKVCGEKRAADIAIKPQQGPIDLNTEPYSLVRDCVKAAQDMYAAQEEYQRLALQAQHLETNVISAYTKKEAETPTFEDDGILKKAAIPGSQLLFSYNQLRNAMVPQGDPDAGRIHDMISELDSADHLNELRKIKTQAMLNRFMTDPDDPISGYDPDRVASAFNEIAAMAPRAAEQAGVLGPLLRRRLAGRVEPFEATEIVKTEKGLKETGIGSKPTPLGERPLVRTSEGKSPLPQGIDAQLKAENEKLKQQIGGLKKKPQTPSSPKP